MGWMGRAVGIDGKVLVHDLPSQCADLFDHPGTGTRKPDVGRPDSDRGHEVEQPHLGVHGWVDHRGTLQSVAQGLVVQNDPGGSIVEPVLLVVPIVNQVAVVHVYWFVLVAANHTVVSQARRAVDSGCLDSVPQHGAVERYARQPTVPADDTMADGAVTDGRARFDRHPWRW